MDITHEQIVDIMAAVKHFQRHHTSITSPRYKEYEVILQLLEDYKETDDYNDKRTWPKQHLG